MAIHLPRRRGADALPPDPPAGVIAIELDPMRRRDVRAVIAIEQRIFPRPWSAALYLSELAQPATRAYYTARADGVIVGYAGCMLVAGEGHITTVGVAPAWQGRRIGMRLLHRLATDARAGGIDALTLEVRVSNVSAQGLYHQFGFVPAGIRKNYYAEVNEDGLVMWAHDVQHLDYARRLDAIATKLTETDAAPGNAAP